MMATSYRAKRSLDVAVITLGLPIWMPAGTACAIAVRLTSPGPVIFRQQRIGRDGRPFTLLKFRTMVDRDDNPLHPDDTRITPVGRFLRRTALDELPQLINVARGEMSVVGPRPALAYQVARYTAVQRRRLSVRPGLTGLAQVRGRNRIGWGERIVHDLEYIDKQSLWLDLRIMMQTLLVILSSNGASGHPTDDAISAPEAAGPSDNRQ